MTQIQNWYNQIKHNGPKPGKITEEKHGHYKNDKNVLWTGKAVPNSLKCIKRHAWDICIEKSNIWYSEREKLLPGWISWKK